MVIVGLICPRPAPVAQPRVSPHAPPPADVLLCIKALELTNVTRAIVWRCSRGKVFIGVVWTVVMYIVYEGIFKQTNHPCSPIAWIVWWLFAIVATLCLVTWTLLDLRAPKPARR